MTSASQIPDHGLVLQPFRAIRPAADGDRLAALLCPPYDVIDAAARAALVARDGDNAVTVVLPEPADDPARYDGAAARIERWVADGHFVQDADPALYVYEMRDAAGGITRGLVGAIELRDPADGIILPHENTMAGPVADRLALMRATQANLEPIYLVYDGGGAASQAVRDAGDREPLACATTADGITHRLWAITDSDVLTAIGADLAQRRALIADGHHRYATYRELQQQMHGTHGAGPWDYGLTLLVDSTHYGPQVHAIHRVLHGLGVTDACQALHNSGLVLRELESGATALDELERTTGFAVVLADATRAVLVTDPDGTAVARSSRADEPAALGALDVTVLHRGLVEGVWHLADSEQTVGYAHSVAEALGAAAEAGGTAVLLRPTPVAAVAAVAAAGARMPRKSTLFTPKPASGLLMRRFADAD